MQPRTFTDSQNRVWTVAIVYQTICDVLAQTGLDLRGLVAEHDVVAMELDNPLKLNAVMGVVLGDQLKTKNLSINDLMTSIVNEDQQTDMVTALYRAVFDFSPAQGSALNDALGKMDRAMRTAKATSAANLQKSIDSGNMDTYLSIMTDPGLIAQWIVAGQNPANADLAATWAEVIAAVPTDKQASAYVALCVERGLTLPTAAPAPGPATSTAPTSQASTFQTSTKPAAAGSAAASSTGNSGSNTPTGSAGSSPASSAATPDLSAGASST